MEVKIKQMHNKSGHFRTKNDGQQILSHMEKLVFTRLGPLEAEARIEPVKFWPSALSSTTKQIRQLQNNTPVTPVYNS
jgi:predicted lipoprotein